MPEPFASVLKLLEDCHEAPEVAGPLYRQQHVGATYKTLAAIGHRVGMETSGTLLDLYPFGMVLNIKGAGTAISWDRLVPDD